MSELELAKAKALALEASIAKAKALGQKSARKATRRVAVRKAS